MKNEKKSKNEIIKKDDENSYENLKQNFNDNTITAAFHIFYLAFTETQVLEFNFISKLKLIPINKRKSYIEKELLKQLEKIDEFINDYKVGQFINFYLDEFYNFSYSYNKNSSDLLFNEDILFLICQNIEMFFENEYSNFNWNADEIIQPILPEDIGKTIILPYFKEHYIIISLINFTSFIKNLLNLSPIQFDELLHRINNDINFDIRFYSFNNPIQNTKKNNFYSFVYKDLINNSSKLNDLFDSLKKNKFISDKNSLVNFKKIFYGKKITKPVIWTGNKSDLYYFIYLLHNKYKLIEDLKQNQWKVTCKCFVREDKSSFKFTEFRGLKKPKLAYKHLENAVNHIKLEL